MQAPIFGLCASKLPSSPASLNVTPSSSPLVSMGRPASSLRAAPMPSKCSKASPRRIHGLVAAVATGVRAVSLELLPGGARGFAYVLGQLGLDVRRWRRHALAQQRFANELAAFGGRGRALVGEDGEKRALAQAPRRVRWAAVVRPGGTRPGPGGGRRQTVQAGQFGIHVGEAGGEDLAEVPARGERDVFDHAQGLAPQRGAQGRAVLRVLGPGLRDLVETAQPKQFDEKRRHGFARTRRGQHPARLGGQPCGVAICRPRPPPAGRRRAGRPR